MQCHNKRSYAGAAVRFGAFIIDFLIVGIITGMVGGILGILSLFGLKDVLKYELLFNITVLAIIQYIIKKIYFIGFTSTSGQTIGKKVFRIKVVGEDMKQPTFWSVVYREVIGRFLADAYVFCFIGYFIILLDEEKRGIHDRLSDTRVVYEETVNDEPELEQYFGTSEEVTKRVMEQREKEAAIWAEVSGNIDTINNEKEETSDKDISDGETSDKETFEEETLSEE